MAKTKEELKQVDEAVLSELVKEYETDIESHPEGGKHGRTKARYLSHHAPLRHLSVAQIRGSINRLAARQEVYVGQRGTVRFYPPEERAEHAREDAEYQAVKTRVDGLRDGLRSRGFEAHAHSYKDKGSLVLSVESAQRFWELLQTSAARGDWKPSPDDDSDD